MTNFLNYALPGIPYGCDFALMALGLVITFRATGVFNLAFGAQAFFAAFIFDLLVRSQGLPVWAAFIVSVLVISPLIGLGLDRFLFRHIPTASMTAKVISAVGLLIALPQMIPIFFGTTTRLNPPSLWLDPNHIEFHIFNTPVNGGELSTMVITLGVVVAVVAMFRWTAIGLEMRAVVESRRLSQLQGIDSPKVAATAWAMSSLLAGLAGVLMLPLTAELIPTDPLQFTSLLVAGLTAAAIASMRSVPIAFLAAVALGVVENVIHGYLPSGVLTQAVVPAFPFVVLVAALLFNPGLRTLDLSKDPLAGVDPPPPPPAVAIRDPRLVVPMRWSWRLLLIGFVVSALTWVPGYWVTSLAQGLVLSTVFLSVTLITGMSGQLSLCQATFAGIGAFAAGQLAVHSGMSVLVGALVGAAIAAAAGGLIALVAVRISGLLLTLVTLAFALFADQFLFQYSWSGGGLTGVKVPRPVIGPFDFGSDRAFLVLALVVLALISGLVALVQRGTTGRFLAAMRGSPVATASLGISLTRAKVTVFLLSAGVAGLGGAFYGSLYQGASASNFNYAYSLAFVVVVITTGSTRIEGAIQAGMSFAIVQLILTYVPVRFGGLLPVLFAVGAMTYAQHPEGIVEYQKSKWMGRVSRGLAAYDSRRASRAPAELTVPEPSHG
ncbi:MAG TPA: ABC transporter permease [Acidimicrobiales bacterium]|nr:ABC transporter permease [Acidimicrobiales bacterium]